MRRRNLRTPAERETRQALGQHAKLSGISQRLSIKVADVTRCQTHKNTDGHSGLSHQTSFFSSKIFDYLGNVLSCKHGTQSKLDFKDTHCTQAETSNLIFYQRHSHCHRSCPKIQLIDFSERRNNMKSSK